MFKSKCEWCGKEKEYKYKSVIKRFCSHKCSNNYKWANLRAKKEYLDFECPICNKKIKIYSKDHRVKNNSKIYCSKKCSDIGHKTGCLICCKHCNKQFYSTRHKFCSKECARQYRKENYNHKIYEENGYLVKYINGYNKKGNAKIHRIIMEEYLERKLSPDEVVHHINHNKKDNRIENLQVMSRGEHSKIHRLDELNKGKKLFQ